MAIQTESAPFGSFSGYTQRAEPREDVDLTHVGPGTPCGEYLRRFWQPIAHLSELLDLPKRIRILGEDLVLFRDGRGQVGLLHLHCAHRGTSLEYGTVEERGIRCCYHGWLYDVDGRLLDTPGEPSSSRLRERIYLGAYPTLEYKGLVFAYLGPSELKPEFPIYDTMEMPGYRTVADGHRGERYVYQCNWLQIKENSMDPMHRVYLHDLEDARASLDDYRPSVTGGPLETYHEGLRHWREELEALRNDPRPMEWQETPAGMMYVYTRRVGAMVWVRIADFIPPNVHQFGVQDACDEEIAFQPPASLHWAVPVDDTHTINLGFHFVPENSERRVRQVRPGLRGSISVDRSYETRQRQPGDYEAQESQRPIAVHALEHIASSDRGVVMVRKLIGDGIAAVQRGDDPRRYVPVDGARVPTCSQNTIQRVPAEADRSVEERTLREVGRRVAQEAQRRPLTIH